MTSLFIAAHVIAAILLLGPVTVATSQFGPQMLKAAEGDDKAFGATRTLHNITNSYGYISAIVPILGIAVFLMDMSTYGTQGQFHASIVLAIIAWALLFFLIIPRQKKAMAALAGEGTTDFAKDKKQLAMFSGIFNLLWVVIAILMFL